MSNMLWLVVAFILGLIIGPRIMPEKITVEVPKIQIKDCSNQTPVNVACPDPLCNYEPLKNNLSLCIHTLKQFTDRLANYEEARLDCIQAIANEKQETEHWRKKYDDYTCD